MFTCILTATGDGEKKVPCAIFKGRGKKLTDDDKEMLKNRKIKIFWSENGWNNQAVTENWLNFINTKQFQFKLVLWYRDRNSNMKFAFHGFHATFRKCVTSLHAWVLDYCLLSLPDDVH